MNDETIQKLLEENARLRFFINESKFGRTEKFKFAVMESKTKDVNEVHAKFKNKFHAELFLSELKRIYMEDCHKEKS